MAHLEYNPARNRGDAVIKVTSDNPKDMPPIHLSITAGDHGYHDTLWLNQRGYRTGRFDIGYRDMPRFNSLDLGCNPQHYRLSQFDARDIGKIADATGVPLETLVAIADLERVNLVEAKFSKKFVPKELGERD